MKEFTREDLLEKARQAQASSVRLRRYREEDRQRAILAIRDILLSQRAAILEANDKDIQAARRNELSEAMIDRLTLTTERLQGLADALSTIASSPPILGQIEDAHTRDDGLIVQRKRIPIGVIGVIFESRPNVLIDCAALAIKSGNAILLKGGSDAEHSNAILGTLVQEAIAPFLPRGSVQVIPGGDRQLTMDMVKLVGLIDLIIPRGGEGLIRMIQEHAKIPVIAHAKGLCHLYLHADADFNKARAIALNAKVQRPSVCNAIETLLVHEQHASGFLLDLLKALTDAGVRLRVDDSIWSLGPQEGWERAQAEDWDTEYLDKILAVRLVSSEDEAIDHILQHGSHHTEAIISNDPSVLQKFEESLDASCLAINASTRFNDGGELGLGAEIGISTTKLHAYGPMGARELTTTRFVVQGAGHCR
ncbi:glutamate-5-semialdehyde dehydrogenase [Oligoflexus tunisiensis]|uniref:glutamate-5-semialdehyde dehydrogenase n=1 Tax=Oligoflexus tunisiensis TaxID=708132 RepID=UPI000AEA4F97|nr:glutamate-5-semialdehyde dehydrogenase [Oligoflexus tunisiensis]